MCNYPMGAANDLDAPYNQPLDRDIQVEVNVEVGTFVNITLPQYLENGHLNINEDELHEAVEQAIKDKLNIDNEDIVLNDISICDYR